MNKKIIHYCWFGRTKLPDLAVKCIESWKEKCSDYEIRVWNEDNFNININSYVRQAYDNKKYAFVTDYVRLYVLYNYGGIYMDTDVEVLKSLDEFLELDAFSGFEKEDAIPTGIMGCKKGNLLFKELLEYYNDKSFVKENGELDLTTNVDIITNILLNKGLVLNNETQVIEGFKLFPKEFFCPKDYRTGNIKLTYNTYTIHHFAGSWHSNKQKFKNKIIKILGEKRVKKYLNLRNKFKDTSKGE
ncbi:glycosyltransferase family 32 protein [Clostridium perfringens]|uniref:Glycosyl transferase n=1 Tax=Clostridium perfringens TaxID=1502 RepID=A0A133MSC7_CLOPF|nr:glycosyltransferase [Clostridium perfringens]EGT3601059.1 glycosyl transferase [Clostridium perfringens]KXA06962.1 hypothetical protein HMPREF3222_02816 [Clostridium perfringens]